MPPLAGKGNLYASAGGAVRVDQTGTGHDPDMGRKGAKPKKTDCARDRPRRQAHKNLVQPLLQLIVMRAAPVVGAIVICHAQIMGYRDDQADTIDAYPLAPALMVERCSYPGPGRLDYLTGGQIFAVHRIR